MTELSRPRGRLAAFFGRLVLATSLAATVVVSAALIALEYRHGREQVEEHLDIVRDSHLAAITESFRDGDRNRLRGLLWRVIAIPHLVSAEARDSDGAVLARAGTPAIEKAAIRRVFPLTRHDRALDGPDGALEIAASLNGVFADARETAWVVIPFNAAWTLLLAGLIFWLAERRITWPLETLARYVREFKTHDLYVPLRLPRRGNRTPDEIDEIEAAVNAMRARLRAAREEEMSRAVDLEALVFERTRKLEASERSLKDAQAVARIGNWERDLTTGKGSWSDEMYRIHGYRPGEVEPHFDNFFATIHPDDRESFQAQRAEAIAGRTPLDLDLRIVRPDGEERWIHTQARIERDPMGKATRLIGTVQDITERIALDEARRWAEAFAGRVVESLADAMIVIGEDGIIRSVNPAAERMFGHAAREMIGADIGLLMPEPHRSAHGGYIARYLRTGHATVIGRGRELTARRKDGTPFPIDLTVGEMKGGKERLFIGTIRDLTERKETERRLALATQKARIADRTKRDFLAAMSHELRTPLNAVLGYADLMRMRTFGPIDNPRYAEYLDIIHASGTHLLDLINNILDVSALEAGALTLREETLDVRALCRDVVRLVAARADKAGVRVETRCPEDLPALVADERRLKQILLNLLDNAVKFTPQGGAAAVAARLTSDRAMVLEVTDNGIGMDASTAAKMLEPFGQADSGLDRKYGGTGLGLPLAKSLVELHGGTLAIDSAPGQGTAVAVRLPPERTQAGV